MSISRPDISLKVPTPKITSRYLLLYIGLWSLFLIHQLTQWVLDISFPLLDSYLDDLLVFPVIMPFLLWIYHLLTKKSRFSWFYMISVFVYVSTMVEFVFPRFSTKFTFDWLDFVAYLLGMAFFVLFQNKIDRNSFTNC